jgi:hypothetical protein
MICGIPQELGGKLSGVLPGWGTAHPVRMRSKEKNRGFIMAEQVMNYR